MTVGLAATNQFPQAEQRETIRSDYAIQGLINAAIANQQWTEVVYWVSRLSPDQASEERTRYWLARAQSQLGEPSSFSELAKSRSYYGFLAAAQQRSRRSCKPCRTADLRSRRSSLTANTRHYPGRGTVCGGGQSERTP